MPYDLAIRPRAANGRCDLVATPAGLVLDGTPLSAMLWALLTHRRAKRDDKLPADMPEDAATPATLNARGGYAGDALNARGELTGSRLYLLARAKKPEALRRAGGMAEEALAPLSRRGLTPTVAVADAGPGRIRITASASGAAVTLPVTVSS